MMRLLRSVDMFPQSFLLIPQARLLLTLDPLRSQHHHQWFVPLLLPIRRAAGFLLVQLPLLRAKLLSPFPPLFNRCYSILVGRFGFLPWAEEVRFGEERGFGVGIGDGVVIGFANGLEFGEFAFGRGPTATVGLSGSFFDSQLVQQRELFLFSFLLSFLFITTMILV